MDDELRAAIAEARIWALTEGGSMEHMSDAEVLDSIRCAAMSMPAATVDIVRDYGLKFLAPVLARFARASTATRR